MEVAARLLDPHDVAVFGELERRIGLEIDGGAARDVVEAHRLGRGIGDGGEVTVEAGLRGFVVVGFALRM